MQAILNDAKDKMEKCINHYRGELTKIRAGRANPAIVESVKVDSYGNPTELKSLANITVPEARLLVIQPWDVSLLSAIEKAILNANLGFTPTNDGKVIRINIPQMTEERRKELVKQLNKLAEENRVAVRNVRRDINESIKKSKKDSGMSEDEEKKLLDQIQKMTDTYIKQIDTDTANKEKEIMTV